MRSTFNSFSPCFGTTKPQFSQNSGGGGIIPDHEIKEIEDRQKQPDFWKKALEKIEKWKQRQAERDANRPWWKFF